MRRGEAVRVVTAAVMAMAIIFGSQLGSSAIGLETGGDFDPNKIPQTPQGQLSHIVFEDMARFQSGSKLTLEKRDGYPLCQDEKGPECNLEDFPNVSGMYMLDSCDDALDPVCVEELTATNVDGEVITGYLDHYYENTIIGKYQEGVRPGMRNLGIPEGEMISVWHFPGLIHSGGTDKYILKFRLYWSGCQDNLNFCNYGEAYFWELDFNLIPFSTQESDNYLEWGLMPPSNKTTDGRAGFIESFPEGAEIRVKIRAPASISKWLRVRAEDVSVETEKLSEQTTRISLQGKPALVPGLSLSTEPEEDQWWYSPPRSKGPNVYWWSPDSLVRADELRDAAGDKATGEIRIFTFKTMDSPGYDYGCMAEANGFGGFVASNAMFYARDAPKFIDGYLTYEIAGMHYNSDGTLARGNYEMVVNKDFASCLYGVEDISPSATIRVLNEQGEQEVAVSTVRENGNWIELSASNFTFSKKEIRVDLNPSLTWTAYQKTLATYSGNNTGLSSQQKSQIRSTLDKTPKAEKFICTGIRYYDQPMSVNIMVRKRAKEACEYAKQLNPTLSTWYQNKPTKARSYAGKVLLTVKSPD